MILLLDNYDSFTFNLYQALAGLGAEVVVRRNDALTADEALSMGASAFVLSPGPGRPETAGILPELLQRLPVSTPLLGVCLGHQALVEAEGGRLLVDPAPMHGKTSLVHHGGGALFRGIKSPFPCARYHSLVAERTSLPAHLRLSAWTARRASTAFTGCSRARTSRRSSPPRCSVPSCVVRSSPWCWLACSARWRRGARPSRS